MRRFSASLKDQSSQTVLSLICLWRRSGQDERQVTVDRRLKKRNSGLVVKERDCDTTDVLWSDMIISLVSRGKNTLPNGRVSASIARNTLPNGRVSASIARNTLPNGRVSASIVRNTLPYGRVSASIVRSTLPNGRVSASVINYFSRRVTLTILPRKTLRAARTAGWALA